jgi:N6-adenosine-specific RNA methylase IME4
MRNADIASWGVAQLTGKVADKAHLYLWTTNSFMEAAHQIAVSWGFQPKTIITWIKNGLGTGYYFRNTTEHLLFATRGNLGTLRDDVPTHFAADRQQHSVKPQMAYHIIEKASPGPRLELFARTHRDGWDVVGNQVEPFIVQELPME